MKKKLLFVSHSHKLEGGAEFSLLATIKASKNSGYDCMVVLPAKGTFAEKLEALKIRYYVGSYTWSAMSSYDSESHLRSGIAHFNADSIIEAYNIITKYKPNAVITNTIMPPWYAYVAKSLNIPNIMMIRESFDKRNSTRLLPTADEYLASLNHTLDCVLYNSNYTKKMYSAYLTKPESAVYYPVIEVTDQLLSRLNRHIDMISRSRVNIITPGSIVEHKNQLHVVKAVHSLRDRGYDNIHLTLMGYADKKGYIEKIKHYITQFKLNDIITIKPFSTAPFDEIVKNEIVIVPSESEAFGRVTLEGQLLGRLVIGCNKGGTVEMIKDHVSGILYDPSTTDSLADSIEWALLNPRDAIGIAKTGQKHAKKKFLSNSVYDVYLSTITSLLTHYEANENRSPYYDPIYALIQRNNHVDSILNKYAKSLNEAASNITAYTNRTVKHDIKHHARRLLTKIKRS